MSKLHFGYCPLFGLRGHSIAVDSTANLKHFQITNNVRLRRTTYFVFDYNFTTICYASFAHHIAHTMGQREFDDFGLCAFDSFASNVICDMYASTPSDWRGTGFLVSVNFEL